MATSTRDWISTLILPEERVTSLGNGKDLQRRSDLKKIDHINCPTTFMSNANRSEKGNEYTIYLIRTEGLSQDQAFIMGVAYKESLVFLQSVVTASAVWWSEFLATRGPGSIPGTTKFSEKQWVWNGVH
jgi:hypothetical protein